MNYKIYNEDCLAGMKKLEDNSIDGCVTDPPYGLEFMGNEWDKGVPGIQFWKEVYRVLKPGATLLAMSGTRTYHILASAIAESDFYIHDMIAWMYGQGFPKAYDISKGMDKHLGADREVVATKQHAKKDFKNNLYAQDPANKNNNKIFGYGEEKITEPASEEAKMWDGYKTAFKPAFEPICVAQKPREGTYIENALKYGVAGFNIDGARVPTDDEVTINTFDDGAKPFGDGAGHDYTSRKESEGRYPANFIHDGSDEVLRGFPESKSNGEYKKEGKYKNTKEGAIRTWDIEYEKINKYAGDSGSAARFFYCAKASRSERNEGLDGMEEKERINYGGFHSENGLKTNNRNPENRLPMQNSHPTVKPIALMEYLVRLIKPPSDRPQGTPVIIDPFLGSGTTGIACVLNDIDFIGYELDEDYFEIARQRIEYWKKKPKQRKLF